MKNNARGQILPVVMVTLVVLAMIVAAMINWIQSDTTTAVNQQKNSSAVNLAEAGIDRGTWKLQSTTSTWAAASLGVVIPGYNFDTTYRDVPGGTYRIKFTNGILASGNRTVTITAEGRDMLKRETRALQAQFVNQTIYSAIMSGGNVSWGQGLGVYWGPVMSQGNLQLMDDVVASLYYPRKYAKGTVIGTAANPRDLNGLNPPNTDNAEWWSSYAGVPPVPVLDFVTMRASAAATGTLNIYGCRNSTFYGPADSVTPIPDKGTIAGHAPWDLRGSCTVNPGDSTPHNQHFGDSTRYIETVLGDATHSKDYVWYWDNDVTLEGAFCSNVPCSPGQSTALRGSVVVRGNLTVDSPGDLIYSGHVPANAWQEQQKLLINTFDTAATREYPGDIGLHKSTGTFAFGTDTWIQPGAASQPWHTTVGVKGFTYVGQNLVISNYLDFNGAVWVNGSVTASYANANAFCGIYYDDTLQVPTLNVILQRLSWQEIAASSTPWP